MKLLNKSILFFSVFALLLVPFLSRAETNTNSSTIIFIQNGGVVEDLSWNDGKAFIVSTYNDKEKFDQAVRIAQKHFDMFNIVVTDDYSLYESKKYEHKIKIIVGSTDRLGRDTGYANLNSYFWGKETLGFVLVNNCNQNNLATDIGHLIAHESGHIFGLEHKLNSDGTYNTGFGIGTRSVGFVMGNFTDKSYVVWDSADIASLNKILGSKY